MISKKRTHMSTKCNGIIMIVELSRRRFGTIALAMGGLNSGGSVVRVSRDLKLSRGVFYGILPLQANKGVNHYLYSYHSIVMGAQERTSIT